MLKLIKHINIWCFAGNMALCWRSWKGCRFVGPRDWTQSIDQSIIYYRIHCRLTHRVPKKVYSI